jgi:hypothetical protein
VGILNTTATTMIAASPAYEAISLDAAGDAVRPPSLLGLLSPPTPSTTVASRRSRSASSSGGLRI